MFLITSLPFLLARSRANKRGDFLCPQAFPQPAILDPGYNISNVHPAHIHYVAAIGDSITAGFAADSVPLEFRRYSFSGGIGDSNQHTFPWLLSHYRDSFGASLGIHLPTVVHDDDPYRYGTNDHFNVAISSSPSEHYHMQLERLKHQMQQQNDNGGWMAVTIFLGENDLCNHQESCGTPDQQQGVLDKFEANMDALLSELIAWRKKLYIQLVQFFWISSVVEQQSWRCRKQGTKLRVCKCMHQGPENVTKLDNLTDRMNLMLETMAEKYDRARPDIGVNLIRTFNRVPVPDLSYLSHLDCFHPSTKFHHLASHSLWNAMLRPSQPTPMSDSQAFVPLCANATSRVLTWRDQSKGRHDWE